VTPTELASTLALLSSCLLLCAFFAASETALFSLRRSERIQLEGDPGPSARAACDLLARPRSLLVVILLVGVSLDALFFSVSADLAHHLAQVHGPWAIPAVGAAAVLLVLVFGEITPKAIAALAPRRTALLAARPLRVVRDALRVLTTPLELGLARIVDLAERRLPESHAGLGDSELVQLVAQESAEGRLERRASELLADVLELGARRVKEVMTPRVDVTAFDLRLGREAFLELLRVKRHAKVPVHDGRGIDAVHGFLRGRVVLASDPTTPLSKLVEAARFVPDTLSLESLLRAMVQGKRTVAIVVDEHGGTAGIVTLEDVVEEIVGDIASPLERPLVRATGDGTWALSGRMGLREAGDILGYRFPAQGPTTLSGFLALRLGRVPDRGDEVELPGLRLRVEAVARRRVVEVAAARVPLAAPVKAGTP
jgi:putative hemolysin